MAPDGLTFGSTNADGSQRGWSVSRLASLLLGPTPPLWLGFVVGGVLIVAEAALVALLGRTLPHQMFGVVFFLGVLVVSAGWPMWMGGLMTLASTVVYLRMHLGGMVIPDSPRDLIPIFVYLPVSLLANVLVGQARLRAVEARRAAEQVSELAARQAALRRVATLVARGAPPDEVLTAVADEVANTLCTGNAALVRYLDEGYGEIVAVHDEAGLPRMPVGAKVSLDGDNVSGMVMRTGRAARLDNHEHAEGSTAALIRELGLKSGVGAPIIVDGRLWGAAVVGSSRSEPPPPDTESRLEDFAELVATAIANTEARRELMASRARIVAAGDEAMRRIERDLHDGAQQRLVALTLTVRSLQDLVPSDDALVQEITALGDGLVAASEELRQITHGIHPAVLTNGGLRPALRALGRRSAIPVDVTVDVEQRPRESVEIGAYYVVAEALTNAAKHAQASQVDVKVDLDGEALRVCVSDDGIGGAATGAGSGLVGLRDRVEALGGRLHISSPIGHGTVLTAHIPLTAA
ncbi:GAF domain-containing protein [Mycolicibacterium brisbanense]